MITFKDYIAHAHSPITEAIRQSDFPKTANLIHKYFTKHLGRTYFFPTPEVFTPRGNMKQVGIKFFVKGNKALRLNWSKSGISSSQGLVSMDYWDGIKSPQPNPSHHVQFNQAQSLATVLPFIVAYVLGHEQFSNQSGVII